MAYRVDLPPRPGANIEAPSAASALTPTQREIVPKLAQLAVGQLLRGEILSRLQDGSYLVRVAGMTTKMVLPGKNEQGDAVGLRLISVTPRPTFLLDPEGKHSGMALPEILSPGAEAHSRAAADGTGVSRRTGNAYPSTAEENVPTSAPSPNNVAASPHLASGKGEEHALASTATQDTAPLRATAELLPHSAEAPAPAALPPSAQARLSLAATLIDQLLHQPVSDTRPTAPFVQTLPAEAPLALKEQAGNAPLLARALEAHVQKSGVFYEAHVAEWAEGRRPLSTLAEEPQMQLQMAAVADQPPAPRTPDAQAYLTQIVQQQLSTYESAHFHWNGPWFAGQIIDWQIQREHAHPEGEHTAPPSAESEPFWSSTVRFELPVLGLILASVHLRGTFFQIAVHARNREATLWLKQNASLFRQALMDAGLQSSVSITHDETI